MVDLSLFSPVFLCFVASIFFLYIEQKTDCIVLYLPFFCFCQTSIYLDTAVLLLCSVFVPLVVYSVAFSLKCLIFSTLRLFSSFVIQDENMFHRTLGIVYFYKAIRSSPTSVNGILLPRPPIVSFLSFSSTLLPRFWLLLQHLLNVAIKQLPKVLLCYW